MSKRDIRASLPSTPMTDPNRFPDYVYKPYPKMMSYQEGNKQIPYRTRAGKPVIVKNEEEEQAFRATLEPVAKATSDDAEVPAKIPESKFKGKKPKDLD